MILGAGFKSMQGLYVYLVILHGSLDGQNEIMSHEESFFFVALLLLLILFCLHYRYRPQLYAALLILPSVLVALVANERRADYVALLVGAPVAWSLIFLLKPHARIWLTVGMFVCVVLGAGYVAAFAHSSGGFAAPARSILSIVNPSSASARDAGSNCIEILKIMI